MFPVESRSNVHLGFDHTLFAHPKCRALRKKFVHSCSCIQHDVRVVNIDKNEIKEIIANFSSKNLPVQSQPFKHMKKL